MYQTIREGGRDVPCIPLKLDAIFYSNVCNLLSKTYVHKCQILMWFWLSGPFSFLVKWDNNVPKAEDRPDYYQQMDDRRKKYTECKDVGVIMKHRELYRSLVQKHNIQIVVVKEEVWGRVQDKELSNKHKDFNWLLLYRRLPVRSTMYAHGLGKSKYCPRENCLEEETIVHLMWECGFAKKVWKGVKEYYECLRDITYESSVYFEIKEGGKQQRAKVYLLLSIVKLKLWRAQQGWIKGVYKWSVEGTCKRIEKEIEQICMYEISKWGWEAIKDRWKAIFMKPPGVGGREGD